MLTIAVTATSQLCIARDRLLRRIPRIEPLDTGGAQVSRLGISSGDRVLDAVFMTPANQAARASVLICHGIGETVEHWCRVQRLLASSGVASLVFDYTGYGRSAGFFTAERAEEDAVAAFDLLAQLTAPLSVGLLGLSLGTGISAAIVGKVQANRLVLCAAFTSLRGAARQVFVPKAFSFAVAPIWDTEQALRTCTAPVLIVHGARDALFPVRMAEDLARSCVGAHKLIVHPDVGHNEPYRTPRPVYWDPIAEFLLEGADGSRG